jgi:hypothetical protein
MKSERGGLMIVIGESWLCVRVVVLCRYQERRLVFMVYCNSFPLVIDTKMEKRISCLLLFW